MSSRSDLTRWNRAGLTRFRYIDGNAVEYLELLRQQLVRQFADPQSGKADWLNPPQQVPLNELEQGSETLVQRQERLSLRQDRIDETYRQDRRDWAWEITRTFARSCHILTEYADAYANEGFLGTATQWDHVRRLVEMLDYHPAPPASASTWLVLKAKQDKKGLVQEGFQVKNSPPTGGDKVIFETLADLNIDYALNELRPKGWDQSDEELAPEGDESATLPPGEEQPYSAVALGPAIDIQGIGSVQAGKLDTLIESEGFKIKDFVGMDPDEVTIDIGATWLWEWKAKADLIVNFGPDGVWTSIYEILLPDIAAMEAQELAEISGNSSELAARLKLDIEIIEICLDQPIYLATPFKNLFLPIVTEANAVQTSWLAVTKPRVEPDEIAMLMDAASDLAEAVNINRVEEIDAEPKLLDIDLLTSPVQYSWGGWTKGRTRLRYSFRWRKKSWLNGSDVIRTVEMHGLAKDAYIGWKDDNDMWHYAGIIETDKRNLRLDYSGRMPQKGTGLYLLNPIEGDQVAPKFDVIVLLDEGGDVEDPVENIGLEMADNPADSIFSIDDSNTGDIGGGGLLPPAKLPKIGSFLFPTPFLPMDLVKAAVELLLNLGVMQIPSTGDIVIKGLPFEGDLAGVTDMQVLAGTLKGMLDLMVAVDDNGEATDTPLIKWDPSYDLIPEADRDQAKIDDLAALLGKALTEPSPLFQQIREGVTGSGPMLAIHEDAEPIAYVDDKIPPYMFEGNPDKVKKGDWVVGEFADGLRAVKIYDLEKYVAKDKGESFALGFADLKGSVGELQYVHADFRGELVPQDATLNRTPIDSDTIELEEAPESLRLMQDVLLTGADGSVLAKVTDIVGDSITTKPSAIGFTKGELIINANLVLAGHGKIKPAKILGSGDAARSNQEFILEVDQVSFVPDSTMSSGVAAAIDVDVSGRIWEQVSSLKDSLPDDHHYAIRMTEHGYVKILFGDGQYGRRLPSGKNNVRVSYRVGSGSAGNQPSHSLEKAVNAHPLVDSVFQYQPATGGGDMESMASLVENAPPTLLALQRAVSLSDFSHLAASQSNIWQATAYRETQHGGRTENVRVVIVPAGGESSEKLESDLRTYLQKHALPGVQVFTGVFEAIYINLTITLRVDSEAYIADEVEANVSATLIEHFMLQNRKLGEHLYLSEVYKIVEGIEGVENSICLMYAFKKDENSEEIEISGEQDESTQLKVVQADTKHTVIYLDLDAGSNLNLITEEYSP